MIALLVPLRGLTALDLPPVSKPPSHPFAPPPLPRVMSVEQGL
jgi:hypothetical protein